MDQQPSSPSPLQMGMAIIIGSFCEHAAKDGDKYTLSKKEVKELLQTQFQGMLVDANDPKQLDTIFDSLDEDSDNVLDFQEFMAMVTSLSMVFFHLMKDMKK